MSLRACPRRRLAAPVLALLLTLAGCAAPGAGDFRFQRDFTRRADLPYRVYLPKAYDQEGAPPWPLIYFLHGAGERGRNLDDLERTGLPKLIAGDGLEIPFVVAAPQCPPDRWWDSEALVELLDHVVAAYHVDPERVYLTGLSMGGTGTWMLAAEHPDRFAAIAPICGRTLPLRMAPLTRMPIWVFHGDADTVVDIWNSNNQVQRLRDAGSTTVQYTVYPGAGHDVWNRTYADAELYAWLLAQRRPPSD